MLLARRYQAAYRELAKRHPSFRQRSEVTELIVEISMQPWTSFKPDGVIIFSDILTPLPALGVPFEIDDTKGPIIDTPLRTMEQVGLERGGTEPQGTFTAVNACRVLPWSLAQFPESTFFVDFCCVG